METKTDSVHEAAPDDSERRLLALLTEIRKVPVNSEGLNARLDAAIADMERVRYLEMLGDQERRIKQTIADLAAPNGEVPAASPLP